MIPLTLAIDTSCDETSVSVVRGTEVLSNVLPSQVEFHAQYGGVVPSLARLAHQQRIDNVVKEAVRRSGVTFEQIDLIAVTIGPGLAIALEVGINKAKELATQHNKPIVTVNHMEGHLLSCFAERKRQETGDRKQGRNVKGQMIKDNGLRKNLDPKTYNVKPFPVLGILVSGKHTEIVLVHQIGKYEIIGETVDDACGEAFDKCGRMLGLGYPAGPIVAEFAKQQRKNMTLTQFNRNTSTIIQAVNKRSQKSYELPVAMAQSGDLNFSYSGLKTAFKQLVDLQLKNSEGNLDKETLYDLCVIFESAAFRPIEIKLEKAIQKYKPSEIWLGGGVSASTHLRFLLRRICRKYNVDLRFPISKKFTTDNAAMIAVAANLNIMNSGIKSVKNVFTSNFESIDRDPTLQLGE